MTKQQQNDLFIIPSPACILCLLYPSKMVVYSFHYYSHIVVKKLRSKHVKQFASNLTQLAHECIIQGSPEKQSQYIDRSMDGRMDGWMDGGIKGNIGIDSCSYGG